MSNAEMLTHNLVMILRMVSGSLNRYLYKIITP